MNVVVPRGNAPRSSGYQPGALLLSYRTMAEGVGNAPTSVSTDPVFETGAASLYLPAFQKWSGWQELHLRPPRSEQGRLLLTLHPENGCQTWTRTKTSGLTGRRATLTPPGNGAAGRSSTCIVPLRRRVPRVFGHGSISKLVSAAGFAPAFPRSQAERVGCYTTRCCSGAVLAPGVENYRTSTLVKVLR